MSQNSYENMSPEQQHYLNILSQKKSLYAVNDMIGEAQDIALNNTHDPQMMQVAKKLNAAEQVNTASISRLYAQQVHIEQRHPEFKQQAMDYAKGQQQQLAPQAQQHQPMPQQHAVQQTAQEQQPPMQSAAPTPQKTQQVSY